MPKKSNAAERIVHATASLLASRGYFGTGLSDIIARAEAPKGSLYHYFPEGKPQIASAAIGFVADEVASFLDRAGTQAPHARNVLQVHTRVDKLGQRMAFASARLHSGERLVASASGVFHLP